MDTSGERAVIGRRALLVRASALASAAIVVGACGNDGPPQAAPPTNPPTTAPPPTTGTPEGSPTDATVHDGAGHGEAGHGEAGHGEAGDGGVGPASTTPGPSADAVDATGEAQVMVLARDNTFAPRELIVSAGTEVVWRNGGRTEHNVIPVDADQEWGVALEEFLPGETYAHVFDEPGAYPYYCTIHGTPVRGMIGTIHVVS